MADEVASGDQRIDPEFSAAELAEFRKWYAEFDVQMWDGQIEADVKGGKLDALGEVPRRARREGNSKEL